MLRSIFKTPKAPKQQEMPNQQGQQSQTPTIDQAAQRAEDEMRLRRRRGRQAYMVRRGDTAQPTVGTKTLTGQ